MKYCWLQCKKLVRMLPFTLLMTAVLLGIAFLVFSQASAFLESDQEAKCKIDIVGETNGRIFNVGVTALKALDSSNLSLDIEITDEETAKNDLAEGMISAYVVIPKGFMKAAARGEIIPIPYYTTTSTVDISALLRDEITMAVSAVLKESQKGVFGEENLLDDNGYSMISDRESDELNIKYIDFIVERSKMYQTEITGVSYGLDIVQHLFIGFMIIILCVSVIPVACLHMRRDNSMLKMFRASGKGAAYSIFGEYGAMIFVFLSAVLLLVLGGAAVNCFFDLSGFLDIGIRIQKIIGCLFPIAIMICAFAFLLFEAFGHIISAVTGYFFFSFGLCYISGCIYPLYALPVPLQKLADFTPMGVARAYVSLSVTGGKTFLPLASILLYTVLFLAASVAVRRRRLSGEDV